MLRSVLKHITLIGPDRNLLATFVWEIHPGDFQMERRKDYSSKPEQLEKLRDRVVWYCDHTGLDELGIYRVVAS